jgi:hypothetical protein
MDRPLSLDWPVYIYGPTCSLTITNCTLTGNNANSGNAGAGGGAIEVFNATNNLV